MKRCMGILAFCLLPVLASGVVSTNTRIVFSDATTGNQVGGPIRMINTSNAYDGIYVDVQTAIVERITFPDGSWQTNAAITKTDVTAVSNIAAAAQADANAAQSTNALQKLQIAGIYSTQALAQASTQKTNDIAYLFMGQRPSSGAVHQQTIGTSYTIITNWITRQQYNKFLTTHSNVTIQVSGIYDIEFSGSFALDGAATFKGYLYTNAIRVPYCGWQRDVASSATQGSFAGGQAMPLSAGTALTVRASNSTSRVASWETLTWSIQKLK